MKTIVSFWKERPGRFIFLVLFTAGYTFLVLLFPYILKDIIDGIKSEFSSRQLLNSIIILGAIGLLRSTAGVFLPYTRGRTNEIFNLKERNNIFRSIQKQGHSFFNRFPAGDVLERMDLDLGELSWFACSGIFRPLEGILTIAFAIYFLTRIDWRLMLIAVLPMSITIFGYRLFAPKVYKYFKNWREIISMIHSSLQSIFSGIRIVKAFTLEKQNEEEFKKLLQKRIDSAQRVFRIESLLQNMFISIEEIGVVLVLLFGGMFVINDMLTIGGLVAFMAYILTLLHPMIDIANFFVLKKRAEVQVKRIEELKNYPPDVKDTGRISDFNFTMLETENLTFSYGEGSVQVLNAVSIKIPAGRKIGLAGTVGSGKSTLLKLLMRLSEPTGGDIKLNGISIKELNLKKYRSIYSYVPQEPSLFSDTIYNNIVFGKNVSEQRLRDVIELAQLSDFIKNCPNGYNGLIGERGLKLSGGEKQRLAIARALLTDAKILILDDATSNLDAETERRLIQRISEIEKMTMIIVSHRLSILSICDYLYVLDKGKIVEEGTPDELIKKRKEFKKLYQETKESKYNVKQYTYKILANSMYGVIGDPKSRLYMP
ncbi:MAG: ATP-binding cassette domain-containing protein, partial [candidate division WOR-3 bacterium]|nr:ATP-binding cassette domain-containing protein [candidate division WOR-3 bacterium]